MSDIELVIKIPEDEYNIAKYGQYGNINVDIVRKALAHGTPLPKGHGDLKDISKIDYQLGCFVSSEGEPIPIIHKIATIEMIRDWLPTIIEADREVNNENNNNQNCISNNNICHAIHHSLYKQ